MPETAHEFIDDGLNPIIYHVVYRKCTPAWEIVEQKITYFNLSYVIQGEALYTINGSDINISQGSLLILPPNTIRKAITFPDRLMHLFSVDFNLPFINQKNPLPFPINSTPGCYDDIINLFHDTYFTYENKTPCYKLKIKGLFLQILHRFLELVIIKKDSFAGDYRITKVIRYITTHYPEHVTVKMMADMVGLNSNYFGLLFKKTMKTSFNNYLIKLRVENAANMLAKGEYKVCDIAQACGFSDSAHFNKQYKIIKGIPPSHSLPKTNM